MGEFLTLFRYELKKQFPAINKKQKVDVAGVVLSSIFTLIVIGALVFLMSIIAKNYISIKIDKVSSPTTRAYELLNLFYNFVLIALIFIVTERMRKSFCDPSDTKVFLRLPIKQQNLFLAKLAVLLISTYIISLFFIIPINSIIFVVLRPNGLFWLTTLLVWLVLPIVVTMFASLIIIPYIKIVEFIKNRYVLTFVLLTIALIGAFLLYSVLLSFIQSYLETGFIKFIFNENFINALNRLLAFTYPANCLAGIVLTQDAVRSYLVVFACLILAGVIVYYITKHLYNITLYKNVNERPVYKKTDFKQRSTIATLIKKEFITVFREPKNMFSYFVIATTMPIMVYCCYTLFNSLINNMLGIEFGFELALLLILVFSVLTNTFCSTNISREGKAILKQKTLPLKAESLLISKIIFCSIVSFSAVILSTLLLVIVTSLSALNAIMCIIVGLLFSLAQILVATKVDLKNVKVTANPVDQEKQATKTVTKVVSLGLILALLVGIGTILLGALAQGLLHYQVHICFVYIIPTLCGCLYMLAAILYYRQSIQKAFDKVSM